MEDSLCLSSIPASLSRQEYKTLRRQARHSKRTQKRELKDERREVKKHGKDGRPPGPSPTYPGPSPTYPDPSPTGAALTPGFPRPDMVPTVSSSSSSSSGDRPTDGCPIFEEIPPPTEQQQDAVAALITGSIPESALSSNLKADMTRSIAERRRQVRCDHKEYRRNLKQARRATKEEEKDSRKQDEHAKAHYAASCWAERFGPTMYDNMGITGLAPLPDNAGHIWYAATGDHRSPEVVLCIHGIASYSFIWNTFVVGLRKSFGTCASSRPSDAAYAPHQHLASAVNGNGPRLNSSTTPFGVTPNTRTPDFDRAPTPGPPLRSPPSSPSAYGPRINPPGVSPPNSPARYPTAVHPTKVHPATNLPPPYHPQPQPRTATQHQTRHCSPFRTIVFDLPGRGRSTLTGEPRHDPHLYIASVHAVLSALEGRGWLGAEERLTVVGQSMGGAVAVLWANRYPSRLQRLVLIAPAGLKGTVPPSGKLLGVPSMPFVARKGLQAISMVAGRRSAGKDFVNKQECSIKIDGMYELLKLQFDNPHYYSSVIRSLEDFPLDGLDGEYSMLGHTLDVRNIQCLLFWGNKDVVVKYALSQRALEHFPSSLTRLYTLDGAGHSGFMEHPEEFQRQFLNFSGFIPAK